MQTEDILRSIRKIPRASLRVMEVGKVVRVVGSLIEGHVPGARVGTLVQIEQSGEGVLAEIVGFRQDLVLMMPFSDIHGVSRGAFIWPTHRPARLGVGHGLLGRAIDPLGRPVDGGGPLVPAEQVPLGRTPPPVGARAPIQEPFETGVRAIDALLTSGRGQRVGLFAGAGVGKTVLIRQIAARARADVVVFGLIGERGCEVRDLLDSGAGDHTVVVVATSDRAPMERVQGAHAATAVAEYFRDQGKHVLLIIDSLTRYAMAYREIALAAGEPPATKGYPPSVFARLPQLLERVCPLVSGGSITAFYTVLVEGDDLSDPVADAARSLLDGHIVLSRSLAARGHFPAIDMLASASRVALQVTPPETQRAAQRARAYLAAFRDTEELRSLGAYTPGAHPEADQALEVGGRIRKWSTQGYDERSTLRQAVSSLELALDPKFKEIS